MQPGTIFSYFVCGKKVNQELIDDIHILLQNAFFQLLLHVSKSQLLFSNFNSNCSNILDLRNLKEQVKEAFCFKHC